MPKPRREQDINIPAEIIKELLTQGEISMIKNRLMILKLLNKGYTIRQISSELLVGTNTVSRISKKLIDNQKIKRYILQYRKNETSRWVFGSDKTND